jgi:hypothetical protein
MVTVRLATFKLLGALKVRSQRSEDLLLGYRLRTLVQFVLGSGCQLVKEQEQTQGAVQEQQAWGWGPWIARGKMRKGICRSKGLKLQLTA